MLPKAKLTRWVKTWTEQKKGRLAELVAGDPQGTKGDLRQVGTSLTSSATSKAKDESSAAASASGAAQGAASAASMPPPPPPPPPPPEKGIPSSIFEEESEEDEPKVSNMVVGLAHDMSRERSRSVRAAARRRWTGGQELVLNSWAALLLINRAQPFKERGGVAPADPLQML